MVSPILAGRSLFRQIGSVLWILQHPLNRGRRWRAFTRWANWHISLALWRGVREFPFVAGTRLVGGATLTAANVHYYVGLGELDLMGFLLHCLRPDDLMIDVGANIGAVSVLAGSTGARVLAIEPVPETYRMLLRNVELNRFGNQVECLNMAIGDRPGNLRMSCSQGAENHVVTDRCPDAVDVPCETLDHVLGSRRVTAIKVDVEGFELPVLRGAGDQLMRPDLLAVILELKGHGARYGYDESNAALILQANGFEPCTYDPFRRLLISVELGKTKVDNVIFVRRSAELEERLKAAPSRLTIWNQRI